MYRLQGAGKTAVRSLLRRVSEERPVKQTGDVRIGRIHKHVKVECLGEDKDFGGKLFSIAQYMADESRDFLVEGKERVLVPQLGMELYIVRRNDEYFPVMFREREPRMLSRNRASRTARKVELVSETRQAFRVNGDHVEMIPEIQQQLADIADRWLPTINPAQAA